MDITDVLKELELLKAENERLKPLADNHLQSVRAERMKSYGIQEEFAERIDANTVEGIDKQVHDLAVALRQEQRAEFADPIGKGNGRKRSYRFETPYEQGVKAYKQATKGTARGSVSKSSIKGDDSTPAPNNIASTGLSNKGGFVERVMRRFSKAKVNNGNKTYGR